MTDSNHKTHGRPLFTLGSIVATPGALEALEHAGKKPVALLVRHQCGGHAIANVLTVPVTVLIVAKFKYCQDLVSDRSVNRQRPVKHRDVA